MRTKKSLLTIGVVAALLGAVGVLPGLGGTAQAATTAGSAVDPNAPKGQCADAALRVRVTPDPEGGGLGSDSTYVDLQNVGRTACVLRGAPGVSLVGHGNGTRIGAPASRPTGGAGPVSVRIAPGQTARAHLVFTVLDAQGGPLESSCHAVKADGYRIYPPHSFRSVFVRAPQYGCANPKAHTMSISFVAAKPVGCATTAASIPKGATRRSIADVDGDFRRDTEWFSGTRFGIRTASGSSTSVRPDVGAKPRALSVVLQGTTKAVSLVVGSGTAEVYRFSGCRLRTVTGASGDAFRFDLTGAHGVGVGCEDDDRNGADQLIGFRLSVPLAQLQDGQTETISATPIGLNGTHAVLGRTITSTTTLPQGAAKLGHLTTVSCRGRTITADGISPAA